jgi:hypothetical protein
VRSSKPAVHGCSPAALPNDTKRPNGASASRVRRRVWPPTLRDLELVGGACEVQLRSDGHEIAQQPDLGLHARMLDHPSPSLLSRSAARLSVGAAPPLWSRHVVDSPVWMRRCGHGAPARPTTPG